MTTRALTVVPPCLLLLALLGCAQATPPPPPAPPAAQTAPVRPSDTNPVANREKELSSQILAYPTGDPATSVILLEKRFPTQARLGKPYVYELKVTNLKQWPISGVLVREEFPASFTAQPAEAPPGDATPAPPPLPTPLPTTKPVGPMTPDDDTPPPLPAGAGSNVTWVPGVGYVRDVAGTWWGTVTRPERRGVIAREFLVGQLGPKESKVLPVTGRSDELGKLETKTTVSYVPLLAGGTDVINPILRLTKEAPRHADLCDVIEYRYVVSNVGTGTETGVRIEEALPEGMTTFDGKRSIRIEVGDVPEKASLPFAIRMKPAKAGEYVGRAVVRGEGSAAQSAEIAMAVHAPKLTIAVTGPRSEYVGKDAPFDVVITNVGDAVARNTTLSAAADGGAAVSLPETPATPRPAADHTAATGPSQSIGPIDPGQSRTVRVRARPAVGGAMNLTVTARADCADPASASARTAVLVTPALAMTVSSTDALVRVGERTTLRIAVRNGGSGPDETVRVVATLPDKLRYVQSTGPTPAKVDGNRLTFDVLPTLEAGKTATWLVEVEASEAGDVRFRADLTSGSLSEPVIKTESVKLY